MHVICYANLWIDIKIRRFGPPPRGLRTRQVHDEHKSGSVRTVHFIRSDRYKRMIQNVSEIQNFSRTYLFPRAGGWANSIWFSILSETLFLLNTVKMKKVIPLWKSFRFSAFTAPNFFQNSFYTRNDTMLGERNVFERWLRNNLTGSGHGISSFRFLFRILPRSITFTYTIFSTAKDHFQKYRISVFRQCKQWQPGWLMLLLQ